MVKVLKAKKVLALKIKIDLFKFSKLFKVRFILEDSLEYKKLASIIYFKTLNNHIEYYTKKCRVTEIT